MPRALGWQLTGLSFDDFVVVFILVVLFFVVTGEVGRKFVLHAFRLADETLKGL